MANASPTDAGSQQALIFIPDISGFTKFVSDTEINHARHIIEELLEVLMDANKIGLQVSEVEGDAILFYRFGQAPTGEEMMQQVKEMFSKFHMHLKRYSTHRICNCGACCTASNLAIKFVSHYGPITMNTIKQYKKLFGKEVIVAHRLLKNDIDSHEYSLFTDNLKEASAGWHVVEQNAWSPPQYAEQEYDSGRVGFTYLSLDPLLNELPEPAIEDYSLKGVKAKVLETSAIIEAPLEEVFNVVADVPWRAKWLPDVMEKFTDINSNLAQTGQTHKCIAKGPIMVSHDYHLSEDVITFTETTTDKKFATVFKLSRLDENRTQLVATGFMKKNFLMETMFRLFMKSKFEKAYMLAWKNLNEYCKSLRKSNQDHPYKIQISKSVHQPAA